MNFLATRKPSTTKKTPRKTQTRAKTTANTKKSTIPREFQGLIYIIVSVITIFSIFDLDGFILGFYRNLVSFFIGYGIYVLPVSFLIVGALCFIPYKGNTSLRTTLFFSFPILISCFVQILTYGGIYRLNIHDLSLIIENSYEIRSGGIIGGFLSIILEAALSSIGSLILLSILIIVAAFVAFNITPKQIYSFFNSTFAGLEHEETEEEIEYKLSKKELKKAKKERQREYNERLKEAKEKAYNEAKEQAEVKVPKKYRNFDLKLGDSEPEFNIVEEKPKIDLWVKEEYEKILAKEAKIKAEKQALLQKQAEMEKEAEEIYVTNIEDIELIERAEDAPAPILFNPPFETEIADTPVSQAEITTSETVTDEIEPPAEILYFNTNYEEEKQIVSEVSKEVEEILSIKGDIATILEEDDLDKTSDYTFIRKEIIPDELKSTMKYEVISNFDKENLEYKYSFPPLTLLSENIKQDNFDYTAEMHDSSERLIETLKSFNIAAQIINIVRGPSITRFEITIAKGIKFSKITSLSDDIALSLGAANVRIATIPDKVAIGIEVPNKTTEMVFIREVLDSPEFRNTTSKLSYVLGKDITGRPCLGDIAKMPHMLIAGTTGSGKSVCVNSMLISLLYKSDPTEVKLIMIDPKMVELGGYNGIPHLLIPVVTDPKKAAGALNWAVGEMMRRYKMFKESNVKDISTYNTLVAKKIENGFSEEEEILERMPQIVIVIDELADLMMIAAKEVEESICRIAQMARAAGMHLVIATQRPSSDVITGLMKANIPSRVSFAVSSSTDSRIILDTPGAEKLIGKGDMLYNPLGVSKPQRIQGCFISGSEIEAVVEYVKMIAEPSYDDEIMSHIENHSSKDGKDNSSSGSDGDEDEDDLIFDAIDVIISTGQASTSFLQRKLKVGYARASRIIDQIEDRGIIGAADGAKPRQILITKYEWQEMKTRQLGE